MVYYIACYILCVLHLLNVVSFFGILGSSKLIYVYSCFGTLELTFDHLFFMR